MRTYRILPVLFLPATLAWGQETEGAQPRRPSVTDVHLSFHQITPGVTLRDANSRSGIGIMIALEGESGRFVLDGSYFPVQSRLIDGLPRRIDVLTYAIGGDFKLPLLASPQAAIYTFAGLRLDYWYTGFDGEQPQINGSGKLGFRAGFGVRLGRVVGEARYRVTLGDVRVNSDTSGPASAWSAYELGVGVLF